METSRKMQPTDRKMQPTDGGLQLPEDVIQHIQSFLTTEEAAQTTVLSKSWNRSWLTRSTLDFDEHDFCKPGAQVSDGFVSHVGKTISRYEKSKLKIEKFLLTIYVSDHDLACLVSEWIVKVVGMGVEYMSIDIISCSTGFMFVLPKEVLKAKSLKTLIVSGCKFSGDSDINIMWFNLETLILDTVSISESMVEDIVTNCPLIEHLTLLDCENLPEVNVSKLLNLREFDFSLMSDPIELMSTSIGFHNRTLGSVIGMPIYRTLTGLVLEGVQIDPATLVRFSVMFPCIKNLSIRNCSGCEVLDISSKSLEFMTCEGIFRVLKFDFPCIKTFTFEGDRYIPVLSFTQCSKEWEARISLTYLLVDVALFIQLKSFLSSLGDSKISLVLSIAGHDDLVGHVQDSSKPVVENLTFKHDTIYFSTEVCSQILYHLLRCLSPKFINHLQFPKSIYISSGRTRYEEFWEDFARRMIQHGTGTTQGLPCIEGLDGVDVEFFETTQAEWQPLPWKTLLGDSSVPPSGRQIRFRLKWKHCATTGAQSR